MITVTALNPDTGRVLVWTARGRWGERRLRRYLASRGLVVR